MRLTYLSIGDKQIVFKHLQSYLFLIWLHCQESIDESASLIKPQSWHCSLGMAFFPLSAWEQKSQGHESNEIAQKVRFLSSHWRQDSMLTKIIVVRGLNPTPQCAPIRTLWFHFNHGQVNMALGSESRMIMLHDSMYRTFNSCWESTIAI